MTEAFSQEGNPPRLQASRLVEVLVRVREFGVRVKGPPTGPVALKPEAGVTPNGSLTTRLRGADRTAPELRLVITNSALYWPTR